MLYIKRVSIVMVGQTILSFRWINKHRLKNSSYHNHFGYEAYALTALNLGLEGIGVLWCWGKVVVMMFGKGDYPIITTSTPPPPPLIHHAMHWPMLGPACPSSQTPIPWLVTCRHRDYMILLLFHVRYSDALTSWLTRMFSLIQMLRTTDLFPWPVC